MSDAEWGTEVSGGKRVISVHSVIPGRNHEETGQATRRGEVAMAPARRGDAAGENIRRRTPVTGGVEGGMN